MFETCVEELHMGLRWKEVVEWDAWGSEHSRFLPLRASHNWLRWVTLFLYFPHRTAAISPSDGLMS